MVQLPKIFPRQALWTSKTKLGIFINSPWKTWPPQKVPRDELLADVAACQGPKIEGTKVSGWLVVVEMGGVRVT